jgi:hypothetical protein
MNTNSTQYHFITRWLVNENAERVYRILENAEDLVRWWPDVYLQVKRIEKGDENGIGKKIELYTKGYLPYRLTWTFVVTEANFPKGFSIRASGDFVGTGVWAFNQINENQTEILYDWRISAEKPLLKYLSWILKPLFKSNHLWAMKKGEESLKKEIERLKRNAST